MLALLAVVCGNALAQDPRPKHGGLMSRGDQDLSAELVVEVDRVVLYVEADDKPVGTTGAAGTLRRLARQRAAQQEIELAPAGDNKLSASGVKLVRGDQVRAYVRFANGREQTFAFTYW
ncbi:MAG TPA: hypothetical protein VLI89_07630 [Burkholderiales bacterium]|nr:hypothetical protein [Burkholderiales bacterium]